MKKTAFLFAVLASALLLAGCKSTKGPTFTNPILGGDYPDPTIMREGEDYYMTHSSFDYNPGLVVFHSRDLVNWEPISYALQTYLGPVWLRTSPRWTASTSCRPTVPMVPGATP